MTAHLTATAAAKALTKVAGLHPDDLDAGSPDAVRQTLAIALEHSQKAPLDQVRATAAAYRLLQPTREAGGP